jgi:GT2 family glycosyltransferase
MAKVGVSIVTYRTNINELRACLDSLISQEIKQIYVVDNARDDSISALCSSNPKVIYIPSENVGYGSAHNKAISRSLADADIHYHLALNPDISFNPDIISEITDYMDAHPNVGTVHPKLIYPDGRLQYSARQLPSPLDVFCRRFLPYKLCAKRNDSYLLKNLDHNKEHNIPFHQGSFMFLRVDALKSVGLFDQRFFMYSEDIDLTRRIRRKYATMYCPQWIVTHIHRAASYHNLRMTLVHSLSIIKYFNKWGWFNDCERNDFNRAIY